MNLDELSIPDSYEEIVDLYKEFKRKIYDKWCVLEYNEGLDAREKLISQIRDYSGAKDFKSSLKVCIGSYVLFLYSTTRTDQCSMFLRYIEIPSAAEAKKFICKYIAKFVNKCSSPTIESTFISEIFSKENFDIKKFDLLDSLVKYGIKAVERNVQLFYSGLESLLFSKKRFFRERAFYILFQFLQKSSCRYFPEEINKHANDLALTSLTVADNMHGYLLFQIILCVFFPYLVSDNLSDIYAKCLNFEKGVISVAVVLCYISFSSVNLQFFLSSILPKLEESPLCTKDISSDSYKICYLMLDRYPDFYNNKVRYLLDVIKFLMTDESWCSSGSTLIKLFFRKQNMLFIDNISEISDIMKDCVVNSDVVELFKFLIGNVTEFWSCFRNNSLTVVLKLFRDKVVSTKMYLYGFDILNEYPEIYFGADYEEIKKIIETPSNFRGRVLENRVPSVLYALSRNFDVKDKNSTYEAILKRIVTSDNLEFKVNSLKVFKSPFPEFLAYPNTLKYFDIFLNDERYEVKVEAIRILKEISHYNPAIINPKFRSMILNSLFILTSSSSYKAKSDSSQLLPVIFKDCSDILAIYIPTFIPIAIQQIQVNMQTAFKNEEIEINERYTATPEAQASYDSYNSVDSYLSYTDESKYIIDSKQDNTYYRIPRPKRQFLSFFNRLFAIQITINVVEAIRFISESKYDSISCFIPEIITLILDSLNYSSHNNVIICLLEALKSIIQNQGSSDISDIPLLYPTLIKLGKKTTIAHIHSLIFQILGNIGLINISLYDYTLANVELFKHDLFLVGIEMKYEDYFTSIVSSYLLSITNDNNLQPMHIDAWLALSIIFRDCERNAYTNQIFSLYIVKFLTAVMSCPTDELYKYINMVRQILSCPREWIQPYADFFIRIIKYFWNSSQENITAIQLVAPVSEALQEAFAPYVSEITMLLIETLENNIEVDEGVCQNVLNAMTELRLFATNFLFVIIARIVKVIMRDGIPEGIMFMCLNALRSIVQQYNCSAYSSSIIKACFKTLKSNFSSCNDMALHVLYSLAVTMGQRFSVYRDRVGEVIKEAGFSTEHYEKVCNLQTKDKCENYNFIVTDKPKDSLLVLRESVIKNLNIISLINIDRTAKSDHIGAWMEKFISVFIASSPSKSISTAKSLARENIFANSIFHAAFLSCWIEFNVEEQSDVMDIIFKVLELSATPKQVLTQLLNLLEFLERAQFGIRDTKRLSILTNVALRAHKPTFALSCSQHMYEMDPTNADLLQMLIRIYKQLELYEEAYGMIHNQGADIFHHSFNQFHFKSWESSFDSSLINSKNISELNKYENEGNWEKLLEKYETYQGFDSIEKISTSLIFAHAFYNLGKWDLFDSILSSTPKCVESIILRAQEGVKNNRNIHDLIEDGFNLIGNEAGHLFSHGMIAITPFIVYSQHLIEIAEFMNSKDTDKLYNRWENRIRHSSAHFKSIRSLLTTRVELTRSLSQKLEFLRVARKSNEWDEYKTFFHRYFENNDLLNNQEISLEYVKYLYNDENRSQALDYLDKFIQNTEYKEYLAKFLLCKALFLMSSSKDVNTLTQVFDLCKRALDIRPHHYKTCNLWTKVNKSLALMDLPEHITYSINAIKGFCKSISINPSASFFDLLQMLSLLFSKSIDQEIYNETKDILVSIPVKYFIPLLPQLTVYQYTQSLLLKSFIKQILTQILTEYTNSAIFTLIVASKYGKSKSSIKSIIRQFSVMQPEVFNAAMNIISGLCLASVTYPECVSDIITKIKSDDYIDSSLIHSWYKRISTELCEFDRMIINKLEGDIKVFTVILNNKLQVDRYSNDKKQLIDKLHESMISYIPENIELFRVAPTLEGIKNIPISVFGTYRVDKPLTTISSFKNELKILKTKNRPRKIRVEGSDGNTYQFLLKSHSDLRVDQRIMQFFELVNQSIDKEKTQIITTSITPLTDTMGVIQWIPDTDTMYSLISEYRKKVKVDKDIEVQHTLGHISIKLDKLLPIQRMEILKLVDKSTKDRANDLKHVMYLKSRNSELWLKQSLTFARTSALMSIVGYVIGLGDRHPSNIMIHKSTGSVIHVDLDICFEIAKNRDIKPELIPFRLTRMMIPVFGPCGIHGSFFKTCTDILSVLRENKELVLSALGIFVRDHLTTDKGSQNVDYKNDQYNINYRQSQLKRLSDKLDGDDFDNEAALSVKSQVEFLINSAQDEYNLANLYSGWKPFW